MRMTGWGAISLFAVATLSGCATTFATPPLDSIQAYREDGLESEGQWELKDGELFTLIPGDASATELEGGLGGVGVHLGLVENVSAHDLVLDVGVTFEPESAIGPVVLAQEADGVVYGMYWFALHGEGATLWRFHQRTWIAVGQHKAPINPAAPHTLRIDLRGSELKAYVDEVLVIEGRHSGMAAAGRFGVMARQGIAGVRSLRYAVLDP